ncbi:MAG: hypothetical protein LBD47_06770, partial [Treponema sp.]|nr:hypothetical protein [Treponema sp.]
VHNVDTLWTDFLKKRIFAAVRRENAMSVRKATDFVDRHYLAPKVSVTIRAPVIMAGRVV